MKRFIKSATILLAAISLAGCSEIEESRYNASDALEISSVRGIPPFALMSVPETKAVITGDTLSAEEAAKGIGLFVTASDGSAYDGKGNVCSNVKYIFNSGKWGTQTPVILSDTEGKLYGYFPYGESVTDLKAIPISSSLNGTDYLYATVHNVSLSNKSVSLQMNHALARLHIILKKGKHYPSDCNLTKLSLESKAIDTTGTMDITTGVVAASKQSGETGRFEITGSETVTKEGIVKDILLVPADNTEGKKDLTLSLTVDEIDAVLKFTGDKGLDIRKGIQCNVTLVVDIPYSIITLTDYNIDYAKWW